MREINVKFYQTINVGVGPYFEAAFRYKGGSTVLPRLYSFDYDLGTNLYSLTGRMDLYANTARCVLDNYRMAGDAIVKGGVCEAVSTGLNESTLSRWIVRKITVEGARTVVELDGADSLLRAPIAPRLITYSASNRSSADHIPFTYGDGPVWHDAPLINVAAGGVATRGILNLGRLINTPALVDGRTSGVSVTASGSSLAGTAYDATLNLSAVTSPETQRYGVQSYAEYPGGGGYVAAQTANAAMGAAGLSAVYSGAANFVNLLDTSSTLAYPSATLTGAEPISYSSDSDTCAQFLARVGASYDAGLCPARGFLSWRNAGTSATLPPGQKAYVFNAAVRLANVRYSYVSWEGWRTKISYAHNYLDGFRAPTGFDVSAFKTIASDAPINGAPIFPDRGEYPTLFTDVTPTALLSAQLAVARQPVSPNGQPRSVSFMRDAQGHDTCPGDIIYATALSPNGRLYVLRVSGDLCANLCDIVTIEVGDV
jgi:hypothetical protein